jgi:hypothetical protein
MPFKFDQTPLKMQELYKLQQMWKNALSKLESDYRHSKGELLLAKARFHNGARDNWKIYLGFKEELDNAASG